MGRKVFNSYWGNRNVKEIESFPSVNKNLLIEYFEKKAGQQRKFAAEMALQPTEDQSLATIPQDAIDGSNPEAIQNLPTVAEIQETENKITVIKTNGQKVFLDKVQHIDPNDIFYHLLLSLNKYRLTEESRVNINRAITLVRTYNIMRSQVKGLEREIAEKQTEGTNTAPEEEDLMIMKQDLNGMLNALPPGMNIEKQIG